MTLLPLPQVLPYEDPRDPAIRGRAVAGHGHLSLAAMPWQLTEGERAGGFLCVKSSHTRRVLTFEEDVGAASPVRLFAKRHRARTPLKALGYRLYPSKARREWRTGWALVRRGFLTGRPVVVAERRAAGGVSEDYLITEAVPAERTLRDLIVAGEADLPGLMRDLAEFVRRLHAAGFYHDDLSADHIWVDVRATPPRFGLIDLDQSRFRWRVSAGRRLMNLFQVLRSIPRDALGREERLAFLAAHHGPRWEEVRGDVERRLHALAAKKGSIDILG